MRKVAFHNLGCKVNAYETEAMIEQFVEEGYELVPFEETADLYIVNTCSVTNMADRKSRQMLHRARKKNPEALVVAVGCYVQTAPAEVLADLGLDLVVGNERKGQVLELVRELMDFRWKDDEEERLAHRNQITDINKPHEYEEMSMRTVTEHTRAFIKVEDGCNQFCSYCIIPYARGRIRSRKPEAVLAEIQALTEKGLREFVLTGIHLSSYGVDFVPSEEKKKEVPFYGKPGLLDLVRMVAELPGVDRIRLGSLEPRIVTEEFACELAKIKKVCPHFHLSLQSGCNTVLKRMNRHYTAEEYFEKCELLRKYFDNPAITTDLIVGFPGETEEEFETTYAFLKQVGFYEMHVFKYSRRKGTVADRMDGQVPEPVKTERSAKLLLLAEEMSAAYRRNHQGKSCELLTEESAEIGGKTYMVGFTREYIRAAIKGEAEPNQIVRGRLGEFVDTVTCVLAPDKE